MELREIENSLIYATGGVMYTQFVRKLNLFMTNCCDRRQFSYCFAALGFL